MFKRKLLTLLVALFPVSAQAGDPIFIPIEVIDILLDPDNRKLGLTYHFGETGVFYRNGRSIGDFRTVYVKPDYMIEPSIEGLKPRPIGKCVSAHRRGGYGSSLSNTTPFISFSPGKPAWPEKFAIRIVNPGYFQIKTGGWYDEPEATLLKGPWNQQGQVITNPTVDGDLVFSDEIRNPSKPTFQYKPRKIGSQPKPDEASASARSSFFKRFSFKIPQMRGPRIPRIKLPQLPSGSSGPGLFVLDIVSGMVAEPLNDYTKSECTAEMTFTEKEWARKGILDKAIGSGPWDMIGNWGYALGLAGDHDSFQLWMEGVKPLQPAVSGPPDEILNRDGSGRPPYFDNNLGYNPINGVRAIDPATF